MTVESITAGYRYMYKGKTYNVLAVLDQTLIQYEDEWWPTVRYSTGGSPKAFVRSTKEFDDKFYPLDERIKSDGKYRPSLTLGGSDFWLVKYTEHKEGVEQVFMEKRGRRIKFDTYAEAKAFGDKVNKGFGR